MATSTYGTPYVQGSDLVSAYPTASSNLATRVDEVSYKRNGLNAQTGTTYTLVAGDAGKTITLSNASAVAVTLPQDSTADLPDGAVVTFYNLGAGTVTISQGTGATLQGGSITLAQYEVISVIKLSANTYGRYDGGQGGLSLITTQSFSAAATVSVNNCFSATYDNYRVLISVTSSASNMNIRMRASGTDNSSSNYYFNGPEISTSSVTSPGAARSIGLQNYAVTGIYGTGPGYASMDIYAPYLAQKTAFTSDAICNGDTDLFQRLMSMYMSVTTSYDGFTIYPASSTITGNLSVYGYRK